MLGRVLVAAIAGLVVWKYRDSLREYAKGNAGPAREKVDGLLRTVQQASENSGAPLARAGSARFEGK
jgi:hypothetical protein